MKNIMKKKTFVILLPIILLLTAFLIIHQFYDKPSCLKDIKMEKYVDLTDYHNIKISKELTVISDEDVENIMGWDFTSDDCYIEETDRKSIELGDVVHLMISYRNNSEEEILETYYEIGTNDMFENDEILINKKIGTTLSSDIIIYDESVYADIEIMGIYHYPTIDDEQFILSYYNCSSLDEVEKFIRERAYNELVYNYMWEDILKNSTIKDVPNYIAKEIDSMQPAEDDLDYIYSYYTEIMTAQAVLEKEGVEISDNDIHSIAVSICEKLQIDIDDIYSYYTYDDLYYDAVMKALKETLVELAIIE